MENGNWIIQWPTKITLKSKYDGKYRHKQYVHIYIEEKDIKYQMDSFFGLLLQLYFLSEGFSSVLVSTSARNCPA